MQNQPQPILQEIKENICTITLNKPEVHNAFDDSLIIELIKILKQLNIADEVRLVILKAKGENFSAGADLNWMNKMATFSIQENEADALKLSELLQLLNSLSKPTLCLTQGRVFGGGIGLVACCDIVIAAEDTKFCFSEVKLGLIPATIAPFIIQKIGYSATRQYFITAETFDATTAKQLGLVHYVDSKSQLKIKCSELTQQILKNGPEAIAKCKQLIRYLTTFNESTLKETAKFLAENRSSVEAKEGIKAFLKKQKPKWSQKIK